MNQHWKYWCAEIPDHTIDKIIEIGDKYPVSEAKLGYAGDIVDKNYRTSDIRWIPPEDNPFISDLIYHYASEANKNAFGFYIDKISKIQYTTYKGEDHGRYLWHADTFWANPTTYDRKLSVVIQLSDENDYVGGDFQLYSELPQPNAEEIRRKGTVIVFPSFFLHCVNPVITGTRRSLVSWIEGPKFK